MKGLAHRLQVVVFDIRMAHDKTVFLTFINDRQHAIVRRNKILILSTDEQRAALGSHTGIHNHDVDCLRGKVGIGRANRQSSVEQIKRRDVVRDVHDSYIGINLQNYALKRSDQMVVGAVVSCERDDRVGQWILSSGIICAWRADGAGRHSHPLTLTEVRPAVKNSRGGCCAIANGPFGGKICSESAHTLFRGARMPVRVRKMSSAIPLTAALARLLSALVAGFIHARNCLTGLFLGFYGCCVHRILHGMKDVTAGKSAQRARSTTPTLFTPLQAIYTRPSVVAAMLRTTPPPEGM